MSKFTTFLKSLVNMEDHIDTEAAVASIRNGIAFRGPNVFILACAIIIASVGLNLNSIPVIIGAMLISPVMGPILGFGLGLGTNDTMLVKDSLKNFAVMVAISIVSSTVFYLISPLEMEQQTELLARTTPTIYDVLIALFGGFAGILETARVKERKGGTVIPGVAIATALMPPLCTMGYGIAHLAPKFIFGAFYLFTINTVFISLATFATAKYLHFPIATASDESRRKRNATLTTVFLILLVVPSVLSAVQIIRVTNFTRSVHRLVQDNKNIGKSYIYDYHTNTESKPPTIDLYLAGEKLSAADREKICRQAEEYGITRSQLNFHEEVAFQNERMTESEIIHGIIDGHNQEIATLESQIDSLNATILSYKALELPADLITREISAQYAGITEVILTRGDHVRVSDSDIRPAIVAIIHCTKALKDDERKRIEQWLQVRLSVDDVTVMLVTKH